MFECQSNGKGENQVLTQERLNQLEQSGHARIERNAKLNYVTSKEILNLYEEANCHGQGESVSSIGPIPVKPVNKGGEKNYDQGIDH